MSLLSARLVKDVVKRRDIHFFFSTRSEGKERKGPREVKRPERLKETKSKQGGAETSFRG
jgi:hypothetical protein